jgi:hypothetical protein
MASRAGIEPASVEPESTTLSVRPPRHHDYYTTIIDLRKFFLSGYAIMYENLMEKS